MECFSYILGLHRKLSKGPNPIGKPLAAQSPGLFLRETPRGFSKNRRPVRRRPMKTQAAASGDAQPNRTKKASHSFAGKSVGSAGLPTAADNQDQELREWNRVDLDEGQGPQDSPNERVDHFSGGVLDRHLWRFREGKGRNLEGRNLRCLRPA